MKFKSIQVRYSALLIIFVAITLILTEEGVRHWVGPQIQQTEELASMGDIDQVSDIIQIELNKIETLSRAITQTVPMIDSFTIDRIIPGLLEQYGDDKIFGGGVWPLPKMRSERDKHSTFYHRNASNSMVVNNYWNLPESLNYYEQPWHQAGRKAPAGTCAWALAYQDDASDQPRTNCAMMIQKNGTVYGVSTIDLTLGFFNNLVARQSKAIDGQIMVVERDGTILSNLGGFDQSLVLKNVSEFSNRSDFVQTIAEALKKQIGNDSYKQTFNNDGVAWTFYLKPIKDTPWLVASALPSSKLTHNTRQIFKTLASIQIPLVLILIALVILALRRLVARFDDLRSSVDALSTGDADLTRRIPIQSDDEIGAVANSVNAFIGYLQSIIKQLSQATENITEKVSSIQQQTQQNQIILHNHANETDQVVTAVTEMSSTAHSVAQDASATANSVSSANSHTLQSKTEVVDATEGIRALVVEVESSAQQVGQMEDAAAQIVHALSEIGAIAEQTNLLALNAAIEAARAGEQGRGFAVVADEVRTLASRTQHSTTEINQVIQSLQNNVQQAVSAMERTKASCQSSAEKIEHVNVVLDGVVGSFSQINDLSTQIATAAEEQSATTEDINQNMVSIRDIVDELVTNGRYSEQHSNELLQANQALIEVVGRFKVE